MATPRVHELSRRDARRIAVRAQLLSSPRPSDALEVVRHLTLLQADPTAAVAPSAELVLWTRLGPESRRGELEARARVGERVYPGLVWMALHFANAKVNWLTHDVGDPLIGTPEYKVSAVRLERV